MRNHLYIILSTILFLIGISNIYAQVPESISPDNPPKVRVSIEGDKDHPQVCTINSRCHVIEGTTITIKFYSNNGQESLEDQFTVTDTDTHEFTKEYEIPGETNPVLLWFSVYNPTIINSFTVTPVGDEERTIYAIKNGYNVNPYFTQFHAKSDIYKYENNLTHKLTPEIEWSIDGTEVENVRNIYYFYYIEYETGEHTIVAKLNVYAPDGETLWASDSVTKQLFLYEKPSINDTNEPYTTLVGGKAININPIAYPENWNYDKIKTNVKWTVKDQTEKDISGLIADNDYLFNPKDAGTFNISADIEFKDEKNNVLTPPLQFNSKIIVFDKPSITVNSPQVPYAFEGDSNINITYTINNPNNLPNNIKVNGPEWTVKDQTTEQPISGLIVRSGDH